MWCRSVSFYQVATRISSVYVIPMPEAAQAILNAFEVFNLNIGKIALLLGSNIGCFGLGTYEQQMFTTMLTPLIIAAVILLCFLILAFFDRSKNREDRRKRLDTGDDEEAPPRQKVPEWAEDGLVRALPTLLLLSFLVFPMVSSVAFRAWACEEFEDAAYLRDDYSVTCWTTSEHRRIVRMAVAGILICAPPRRPEPSPRLAAPLHTALRAPLLSPLLSRVRVAAADDLLDHMIRHDMARRGKDTRSPTFNEALALESTASAAGPSVPSPPTVGLYSTS